MWTLYERGLFLAALKGNNSCKAYNFRIKAINVEIIYLSKFGATILQDFVMIIFFFINIDIVFITIKCRAYVYYLLNTAS